jgi:hypothetical protein
MAHQRTLRFTRLGGGIRPFADQRRIVRVQVLRVRATSLTVRSREGSEVRVVMPRMVLELPAWMAIRYRWEIGPPPLAGR